MKTGFQGKITGHFVEKNAIHNAVVLKNLILRFRLLK